jgi:hypothetical protein
MNVRQISAAVMTASTLLTASFPAFANPFQVQNSAVFRNPAATVAPNAVSPAAIGNAVNAVGDRSQHPARSSSEQVGNSEIQGLGNHDSWIDTEVLANDPRAMCSDVSMGSNVRASSTQIALSDSRSDRTSEARSHNDGGGGGGSFLGIISVSGNGASQGSQNASNASDRRSSRSESRSENSSTVVVGRNCDAFVQSAAARDMNYEDNLTERYRIRSGRRGEQVDGLLQVPQR